MSDLSYLLPFIAACLAIEATPGPNMGYLALLSVNDGRRAGFDAVAGVAAGLLIVGMAAALGMAAVISESPLLYQILRWGGVAYLLWLAWEGWQRQEDMVPAMPGLKNDLKFFRRGLITNLLNPKAAVFYIAVLPGFVNPGHDILNQTLFLTFLYVAIATVIHCAVVLLAARTRRFLHDPGKSLLVRRVLSELLAIIAVWFAFATGS